MQVVTFRLQNDLYEDAKARARQLGFTTISQYLRSLLNMDIHGTRMFDKVEPAEQPAAAPSDPNGTEPPAQSDPQEVPATAE